MNSKEYQGLMEAYSQVYNNEELSEAPFTWDPNKNVIAAKDGKLGIMTKGDPKSWRQPSEQEKGEIPISSTNKFKNSPAGQKFIQQRQMQMNSLNPFDVIKGHLLDEGYANDEKSALAIMANMSESWKKSIIEAEVLAKKDGVEGVGTGSNWKEKSWTGAEKQRYQRYSQYKSPSPSTSPKPSSSTSSAPSQPSGTTLGATPSDVALYRLRSQEKDREFRAQARANERTPDAYRSFLASQEREKNRQKQKPMGGYGYKGLAG